MKNPSPTGKKNLKKNNLEEKFLEVNIFHSPLIGKASVKEKATAVSSKNHLGNFDILPGHANFISLIIKTLTIHASEKKINFQFERGILEVSEDKVNVFLGL